MWTYAVLGALLGLSAGISPGPLLALVVSQSLRHGVREGAKVAAAPLLTDGPIILGIVLTLNFVALGGPMLGVVSLLGAVFLAHLGLSSLRAPGFAPDGAAGAPKSYLKGVLVNYLSPHPYLFWISVGVPLIVRAAEESAWAAVGFVAGFFACIVGAKIAVAVLVGRSRTFFSSAAYRWTLRLLGVLLIGFALSLAWDGIGLLAGNADAPAAAAQSNTAEPPAAVKTRR